MKSLFTTIPYLSGDGIGPEIMATARNVVDQAVQTAYQDSRKIDWKEVLGGKTAFEKTGKWLPEQTLEAFRTHRIGLKGPLTTPVGGGIRSLNVQLRQALDLFVCLRRVRWFEGLPSPNRYPQGIDITIFRENTEDIYTGIEYEAGSEHMNAWLKMYEREFPEDFQRLPHPYESGIGIKPISRPGSQRFVRAALKWAVDHQLRRVTLVHKGNIMKYTEGAFRNWGYEVAEREFSKEIFTQMQYRSVAAEKGSTAADELKKQYTSSGKIWMDDVIADVAFEQLITNPQAFDLLVATNLNGDYLSDAAAALAGGVGISPGGNINFEEGTAIFEANHGSAEGLAGKDQANPSSLILSTEMMLRFMGWEEAADLVWNSVRSVIQSKRVTFDLASRVKGAKVTGTQEFAQLIIDHLHS